MTDYAEKWTRYRRVLRLTILSFIGCFAFGVLIGLGLNEKRQPVVFATAGSVDALCFLSLCYNGLRLSWFRCPRCGKYFFRGKKSHCKRDGVARCRHCGLALFETVTDRS